MILHTLGATLPFVDAVPESISKFVKKAAVEFSRFGYPVGFLREAVKAWQGKRLFEVLARIGPPATLLFLPFYNFQLGYGLYAGINLTLERIMDRIKLDNKDFQENNKKVIDEFKKIWNEVWDPQIPWDKKLPDALSLLGSSMMLGGAIPALALARNSLDSWAAMIFGTIRSLGGAIGDLVLIFFSKDPSEKYIGGLYGVASLMDIPQRFIKDKNANEIYNHAKTTLNTIAAILWAHKSTLRNQEVLVKPVAESQVAEAEHPAIKQHAA